MEIGFFTLLLLRQLLAEVCDAFARVAKFGANCLPEAHWVASARQFVAMGIQQTFENGWPSICGIWALTQLKFKHVPSR